MERHKRPYQISAILSSPDLGDQLGESDVISVELVKTVKGCQGGSTQRPRCERAGDGEFALVQVVGEDAIKADVRVDNK